MIDAEFMRQHFTLVTVTDKPAPQGVQMDPEDLQKALGEAVAQIEQLESDLRAAQFVNRYERAFPRGD